MMKTEGEMRRFYIAWALAVSSLSRKQVQTQHHFMILFSLLAPLIIDGQKTFNFVCLIIPRSATLREQFLF
jgi:hypothetical protein